MGIIIAIAVVAIITGLVWLIIIAKDKQRRLANPKGWRIPTIILAGGIVLCFVPRVISSGLEGVITMIAGFAISVGIIWLIIALTKKRRTANPQGWRIPAIILGGGIALCFVPGIMGIISSGSEKRQTKERAQEEAAMLLRLAEADSAFAWTIVENPDTVSRSAADSTIVIFKRRGWEIPDNFRKHWIDLRLAWVDTLSHAETLTEYAEGDSALNEILAYKPLSQSQQSKLESLRNRLVYKTRVLKAKLAKQDRLAKIKADKEERLAGIKARKEYADRLEYVYLDNGRNTTITALGSNATTLKIKWVLMSRVTANEYGQSTEFLQLLRKKGFKKLILTDGYNATWYLDLIRMRWD